MTTADTAPLASSGWTQATVRFSSLVVACLFVYVPVLWLTFAFTTSDINPRTVGFATILAMVLGGSVLATRRLPVAPLIAFWAARTSLSYLVPFWYVMSEADPGPFFWGRSFTAAEFDHAFLYLVLFSMILGVTMIAGSVFVRRQREASARRPWMLVSETTAKSATVLLVGICAVDLAAYYLIGLGRYTDIDRSYLFLTLSNLVWPPEAIAMFFFVALAAAPRHRRLLLVGSVVYFLCATLTGSKGGPYYLLLFWLYAALAASRDPLLRVRALAGVGVLAVVASAFTLYVGHYIKQATRMATVATGEVAVGLDEIVEEAESKPLDSETAMQIPVRRNSELEQMLAVSADPTACAGNLSWLDTIESAIDRVLPGTYFDRVPTERIYAVCYRGIDEDQQLYGEVRQNDKWGLAPLLYAYSGFGVSLVTTALLGLFLGAGFAGLLALDSVLWLAWGLAVFDTTYAGFGFDYVAANYIPIALQFVLYLMATRGMSSAAARWAASRATIESATGPLRAGLRP